MATFVFTNLNMIQPTKPPQLKDEGVNFQVRYSYLNNWTWKGEISSQKIHAHLLVRQGTQSLANVLYSDCKGRTVQIQFKP